MSFWFSGDIPLFCVCFMARREENCSEWILQNYEAVREIYARSMLCLVLGFRADTAVIPFLMRQIERFEQQFPRDSFERRLCWPFMSCAPVFGRFDHRERAASNCPQERPKKKVPAQETASLGPAQSFFIRGGSRQWQFGPTATGLVQAHRPLASQIWQRTKRS